MVCNPDNTLKLLQSPLRKRLYKSAYWLWAGLMVASPPVIIFLGHFISCDYQTLEIEIAMIWPFGGYWLTKSREVADIKAGR